MSVFIKTKNTKGISTYNVYIKLNIFKDKYYNKNK